MKHLNEIFLIERRINQSTGEDCFLTRMSGGVILLGEETEKEGLHGSYSTKTFIFKCVSSGHAELQFATTHANQPDVLLYEDILEFEISDKVHETNDTNEIQEVSKIVCMNDAGFVQQFCIKMAER